MADVCALRGLFYSPMLGIYQAKSKRFPEDVSRFPCPTVEEKHQGGGRPDGSDVRLPLGGLGTRFVVPFIRVGQESDDPKMLRQIATCKV